MMPEYVGVEQFAKMFGCSTEYARQLIRQGKCPRYVRFGRKYQFRREDIEDWVERHTFNPENK